MLKRRLLTLTGIGLFVWVVASPIRAVGPTQKDSIIWKTFTEAVQLAKLQSKPCVVDFWRPG